MTEIIVPHDLGLPSEANETEKVKLTSNKNIGSTFVGKIVTEQF